ncbi:MAG: T9SS type A sorting domain-containing protein [Vicingaceae bacterium]|nr:T9SS type A sorting domain-containing protein [Vicingaceae bacterium]
MQLKNYILALVFFLMVTTIKGQFIWQIALGTPSTDYSKDMIAVQDGNYLVLGSLGGLSLYLAKIDTGGNVLWEKTNNIGSPGIINSICETVNNNFVVSAKIYKGGSDYDSFLIKLDASGDTLFTVRDSANLGSEVYKVWLAPDGNLLATINYHGAGALVKVDNNFNILARIDTFEIKGLTVVNNKIYVINADSTANLFIINNDFTQIDTINVPIFKPEYIRQTFDKTELVIEGAIQSGLNSLRKLLYLDLVGNITKSCDSTFLGVKYDFQPIDAHNNWLYVGENYQQQWGKDVRLYWTNKCGQVIKDTILYRWSLTTFPLNEEARKLIVDNEGNYLVTGYAQEGPLGDNDIFVFKYKKVTMPVEEENEEEEEEYFPAPILYPNPFTDGLIIKGISTNTKIMVFDVSGRIVEQQVALSNSFVFNTTHWAKGIYVIQLRSITTTTNLKVVKQ